MVFCSNSNFMMIGPVQVDDPDVFRQQSGVEIGLLFDIHGLDSDRIEQKESGSEEQGSCTGPREIFRYWLKLSRTMSRFLQPARASCSEGVKAPFRYRVARFISGLATGLQQVGCQCLACHRLGRAVRRYRQQQRFLPVSPLLPILRAVASGQWESDRARRRSRAFCCWL